MKPHASLALLLACFLPLCSRIAAADIVLTSCGTTVPEGVTATLAADLDCSAGSGHGIIMRANATLRLNGFSLIGNPSSPAADGVHCVAGCIVYGPGTIRDFSRHGVDSPDGVRLIDLTVRANGMSVFAFNRATITNCTIDGNISDGVTTLRLHMEASIVSDNGGTGVVVFERPLAKVIDSTIIGNGGLGIYAFSDSAGFVPRGVAKVVNSVVSGNGTGGLTTYVAVVTAGSDVSDNGGDGISSIRAVVKDASVTGNDGSGVFTRGWSSNNNDFIPRVRASECTITGNGLDGIVAAKLSAAGCTVTGNRLDADCGVSMTCADLKSFDKPRLKETVCETSYSLVDQTDWDVCSLDPM